MSWPMVSIVFPNYNGKKDCLALLASLPQLDYPPEKLEIIMVDNGSTDKSARVVAQKFPAVKIIRLKKNIGPGAGRNKGIKKATGKYILCTDNDIAFDPSSLKPLIEKITAKPDIGVVGGKILAKKSKDLVSCGYHFNPWLGIESGKKNCRQEKKCDWVSAAFMLFEKKLTDKVGLFDPRFFFFAEEADFCFRAKKAGLKIVYTPKAIIYHGRENGKKYKFSPKKDYFEYYQSKFRLILKHLPWYQKLTCLFSHLVPAIPIRFLMGRNEFPLIKLKAIIKLVK